MRIFGVIASLLFLSACTSPVIRPPIELHPITKVSASTVGHSQPVLVSVTDTRNQDSYSTANIAAPQNISQIMSDEISSGLKKQGFNPVTTATNQQSQIEIKLITLDYRALSGYVSTNSQSNISAEVTATNISGQVYKKTYNASVTNDSYARISFQTPSAQVNQALDKLLNNILNDSSLIQFLAKS